MESGERIRLDLKTPQGKIKRAREYMAVYEDNPAQFFWRMFEHFENDPQAFSQSLRRELINYSNLYKMNIQTLVHESLRFYVENHQINFNYGAENSIQKKASR